NGSDIRGFEGVAGGVIRWIRLANDTAVAVDQLGVRQGAVAVYLDIWHKDMPEFLGLRTNNGDDRMKAHDVFPGVCVPDLFWKEVRDNMEGDWHMFDPHEVEKKYGKAIEDTYGEEFEEFYKKLVNDKDISRRVMPIKDMVRLLIKSWSETGTPFIFNRDLVNKANPNKHKGIIYSSNLCTEIAQNMSPSETISTEIVTEDGDTVIVNKTKPGDFVECNLASLTLGKLDVNNEKELEETVRTVVRALDNVIDLNYYPTPYAEVTNKKYRAIGLGTSGYHHMIVKNDIKWSDKKNKKTQNNKPNTKQKITNKKYRAIGLGTSGYHHTLVKNDIRWSDEESHAKLVDRVYEDINYYAIKESVEIAKDKGSYQVFEGSDWQNGNYFTDRDYTSERWEKLEIGRAHV